MRRRSPAWFFVFSLSVLSISGPPAWAHEVPGEAKHRHQHEGDGGDVSIRVEGGYRIIQSNGLPNHATGQFPGPRNPNRISAQSHRYRVTVAPKPETTATPLGMHPFGVAMNGVPFDPGAAEFWNRNPLSGWQYEAMNGVVDLGLDANHGHVQPTGAYHYHGSPIGLIRSLSESSQPAMILLGYAADGYPIYNDYGYSLPSDAGSELVRLSSSYVIRKGQRPAGRSGPGGVYDGRFVQDWHYVRGAGDLDEYNGRTGVTPEYPDGTFYYVITEQFPYIPRQFKGKPDASFLRHGPAGGPGGRRRGPPGRGGPPRPWFSLR